MTLPTPPRYVVLPEEVIDQAFAPDKPRRALLASFTRILSLAWESKYQHTPPLDELELIAFLKLSRRQFYEQMADMELIGWLRSSRPHPGFVQFSFSRPMSEKAEIQASAENRIGNAEIPLVIGGGESKDSNLITDSLTPPQGDESAENRTFPNALEILRHTDLLFDGSLVVSRDLGDCEPLHVLAWCAYAYKTSIKGAAGIVRNRLKEGEPPPEWAKQQWQEVLPTDFLEALGLIEYTCEECQAKFKKMADLEAHQVMHPRRFECSYCDRSFAVEEDLDAHIDEEHVVHANGSAGEPIEGSHLTPEQAWQSVLDRLQTEMPRAHFGTWIQDSHAVRYGGNTLYIGVRNAYVREWLEDRFASALSRLLVGILNATVAVKFVVAEEGDL